MIVVAAAKVVFDAIYEVYGINQSTNWSITGYVVDYLLFSSVLMFIAANCEQTKWNIFKAHIPFITWICNVVGIMYMSYAAIELTYINEHYEVYKLAMRDGYFKLHYAMAVASAISFYLAVYFVKKKLKLKQWI